MFGEKCTDESYRNFYSLEGDMGGGEAAGSGRTEGHSRWELKGTIGSQQRSFV